MGFTNSLVFHFILFFPTSLIFFPTAKMSWYICTFTILSSGSTHFSLSDGHMSVLIWESCKLMKHVTALKQKDTLQGLAVIKSYKITRLIHPAIRICQLWCLCHKHKSHSRFLNPYNFPWSFKNIFFGQLISCWVSSKFFKSKWIPFHYIFFTILLILHGSRERFPHAWLGVILFN